MLAPSWICSLPTERMALGPDKSGAFRACTPGGARRVSERARLSVVIPVRDAQTRVEPTLCSVLDDSDSAEFEAIVVMSDSADRRAASRPDVQDPRVVMVHLRPGQSAARLRNVGLARAKAPYVAFLEPYDVLTRHMLSRAVCELDRNPEA